MVGDFFEKDEIILPDGRVSGLTSVKEHHQATSHFQIPPMRKPISRRNSTHLPFPQPITSNLSHTISSFSNLQFLPTAAFVPPQGCSLAPLLTQKT
jgi:hypothetical protein